MTKKICDKCLGNINVSSKQVNLPQDACTCNPTAEEINALPEKVRRYIYELETNVDPAGEIRRCRIAEDENKMLRKSLAQHKKER